MRRDDGWCQDCHAGKWVRSEVVLVSSGFLRCAPPAVDFELGRGFGEEAGEHAFGIEMADYEPPAMRDDVVVAPGGTADTGRVDAFVEGGKQQQALPVDGAANRWG